MDRQREVGSELFTALDQLDAVADLLRADSPVKARMALVLLDALADGLLFRRLELIYEASADPFRKMPRYPLGARRLARQRFNRRVELVRQTGEFPHFFGGGGELIDEADAAILKVGHGYRNDAYHEDTHNEAVVGGLARALFVIVAHMVARSQPSMASGPLSGARIEQLARWGYGTTSMLDFPAAADAATEHLIAELRIEPPELRELFAVDLESRARRLATEVDFLNETTIDPAAILKGVELHSYYGADEELLELEQQLNPLTLAEERATTDKDRLRDLIERAQAAAARYRERQAELESEHRQRVSLDLLEQARKAAKRLRLLDDVSRILVAYRDVEAPLAELERYVERAVLAVDREIQLQQDLERGK